MSQKKKKKKKNVVVPKREKTIMNYPMMKIIQIKIMIKILLKKDIYTGCQTEAKLKNYGLN